MPQKKQSYRRESDSVFDESTPFLEVFRGGCYKWLGDKPATLRDAGRVLVEYLPKSGSIEWKDYGIKSEEGLFKKFSRLEPTEEAFEGFANQYGFLGVTKMLTHVSEAPPGLDGEFLVEGEPGKLSDTTYGEPFRQWVHCWRQLKNGTLLLDAIRDREESEVLTRDSKSTSRSYLWGLHERGWKPPSKSYRPTGDDIHDVQFDEEPDDARIVANNFLRRLINDWLKGGVCLTVLYDAERKANVLRFTPKSLIDAMWWQLARAYTGKVQFRDCRACGEPIPIGKGINSKNKEFCSPACKTAGYRAKVDEAKEMADAGKTAKQIASHFTAKLQRKVTAKMVEAWLAKAD